MSSLSGSENPIERDPGAPEPTPDASVDPTHHIDPEQVAIAVTDLHVTYRVNLERKSTLKNALVKGRSLRPEATGRERNDQVGGHHA